MTGGLNIHNEANRLSNPGPSAGQQLDDDHDDRHDQQEVDKSSGHVADQTQKPEHKQDDDNGPKHKTFVRLG
jgi:hypothetical protein